jgi:CO/xanthine dehydrogenase FAD-binding subunit
VIPASFDYARPATLAEAIGAVTGHGPEAAVLAGGQSLIADLKSRRRRPRLVIDLGGLPDLDTISVRPDAIEVGAMARQATIAGHSAVAARLPLLVEVAAAAADPKVRRRGTLVGACCEAAPGGDWAAAALALDGSVLLEGPGGPRDVALTEFIIGPAKTALRQGEIARALRLPLPGTGTVMGYRKVKHASVGWSVASAAIVLTAGDARGYGGARVAVSGAPAYPQRLPELEAALPHLDLADPAEVGDAVGMALASLEYQGDYHASPGFRRRRLGVLLRRSLMELHANGQRIPADRSDGASSRSAR